MSSLIRDYLKKENVRAVDVPLDWRGAVRAAAEPLVEQGYITAAYPLKIMENTEQYGAWYVVREGIALLHARPEDGVVREQLGVTVFYDSVDFCGHMVRLAIAICSEDSDIHMDLMGQLAELLMDDEKAERLLSMTDPAEIWLELTA